MEKAHPVGRFTKNVGLEMAVAVYVYEGVQEGYLFWGVFKSEFNGEVNVVYVCEHFF